MMNKEPFKKCEKWSESRRLELLHDLNSIIINNVTFAIGMAVHIADYNKVLSEEPDAIHHGLGSPYAFCAYRCFESGADWSIKHRSRETINYIFERGDQHAEQIDQTHRALCELEPLRRRFWLGSLTFDPKYNTSLQAADLLTWALNRELYHKLYPEPEYEYIRPTLTNLLASVDNIYKGYYEDDLRGYLKDLMDKRTRNRNKKKGRFLIINIPENLSQSLLDELKARSEKRSERKNRISRVRRNDVRIVSRTAKRVATKTGNRMAAKAKKKRKG
jgi:hypothetical protein